MRRNKRSAVNIIISLAAVLLLLVIYGMVKNGDILKQGLRQDGHPADNSDSLPERADTGYVPTGPESFDSSDTAVLVAKNKDEKTVTFLNLQLGRRYTLGIDGTTRFSDKYGESVSLEQIRVGDIVDVRFLKDTRHATHMQQSFQAWKNESVSRYEIDSVRSQVAIGEEIYKLTKNTQYFSGGRAIEVMDLNAADVLSFQGIDNQVLSVSVEKGHGYLRLENGESFVGGWIEIGQEQIQRITEDMLLVVPEGSYKVNISHRGGGGIKSAVINRNEETVLDIGDLEIPDPQKGTVIFSISPSRATLFIDGTETDYSLPVILEYGLHQLIVKADKYKSITRYIRVGQASAGVNIELELMGDGDTDQNASSVSDGDVTSVSGSYKVFVDAPEGVEAYLDGSYVGITPCSFKKQSGAHVLTLRKSGYKTRSYTLQVDKEDKDISFSFAALEASGTGSSAANGTSALGGNALDANQLVNEMINSALGGLF